MTNKYLDNLRHKRALELSHDPYIREAYLLGAREFIQELWGCVKTLGDIKNGFNCTACSCNCHNTADNALKQIGIPDDE